MMLRPISLVSGCAFDRVRMQPHACSASAPELSASAMVSLRVLSTARVTRPRPTRSLTHDHTRLPHRRSSQVQACSAASSSALVSHASREAAARAPPARPAALAPRHEARRGREAAAASPSPPRRRGAAAAAARVRAARRRGRRRRGGWARRRPAADAVRVRRAAPIAHWREAPAECCPEPRPAACGGDGERLARLALDVEGGEFSEVLLSALQAREGVLAQRQPLYDLLRRAAAVGAGGVARGEPRAEAAAVEDVAQCAIATAGSSGPIQSQQTVHAVRPSSAWVAASSPHTDGAAEVRGVKGNA
eukprot:CAMPEP_0205894212 /NCGR_PEP_ID=MMETSP1083-20121108/23719_1 /ASSEMBLY_ACC=CAM_ASM_000430 /TAXON_ID=97485 /ORGANISM="Prymnesium parvum, Strain Texoma1" /LENGTH=305 /DNA_ID=CAMNT_0053259041 /DNA_START=109 /DNA_END=1027 /DNA_ORIENTATION=-